jgi:hypothetical protein
MPERPAELSHVRALHVSQAMGDADAGILTTLLPSLDGVADLLLDATRTAPADEGYDAAGVDGGGPAEGLAGALSAMPLLRRLSLRWPLHGTVPIAAALPALRRLEELTLSGQAPALGASGITVVATAIPSLSSLRRCAHHTPYMCVQHAWPANHPPLDHASCQSLLLAARLSDAPACLAGSTCPATPWATSAHAFSALLCNPCRASHASM